MILVPTGYHRPQGARGPARRRASAIHTDLCRMKTLITFLCAICLLGTAACSTAQSTGSGLPISKTDLPALEFRSRIEKGGAMLVDVRTPAEYASGHIAGAVNLDWSAADYEKQMATLDPKMPVLVYCAMGGRSEQAKEYLEGKGLVVIQLVDGIGGWKKAGLPVVK